MLELDDIQALLLRGHGDMPQARYLLLRVTEPAAARRALRDLLPDITSAARVLPRHGRSPVRRHLAFAYRGLESIGLPGDSLCELPLEFREGLDRPARARLLGDDGASDPAEWQFGGARGPAGAEHVHALLAVFAATPESLARALRLDRERVAPGFEVVDEVDTLTRHDRTEHFGFLDGIAQPLLRSDPATRDREHASADGEFILGYANEYGRQPWSPSVDARLPGAQRLPACTAESLTCEGETERGCADPARVAARRDLGRNGTYFVLRKLHQDVGAFWRYFGERAAAAGSLGVPDPALYLAAKFIGRWPDGTPLTRAPDSPIPPIRGRARDDFDYSDDPHGQGCPFGAHIRRTNPRASRDRAGGESISETRFHRLLRRGRSYGASHPDPRSGRNDSVDRGLVFIAMCASLRRQFEFVQQTWMVNRRFATLDQDPDPIAAGGLAGDGFTVPRDPVALRLSGLPRFVTMRGGGYFFMPGLRALEFLANLAPAAS